MVYYRFESSLVVDLIVREHLDPIFIEFKESILKKYVESFSKRGDGVLIYQGRLCIHDVDDIKRRTLQESHGSRYSIHL